MGLREQDSLPAAKHFTNGEYNFLAAAASLIWVAGVGTIDALYEQEGLRPFLRYASVRNTANSTTSSPGILTLGEVLNTLLVILPSKISFTPLGLDPFGKPAGCPRYRIFIQNSFRSIIFSIIGFLDLTTYRLDPAHGDLSSRAKGWSTGPIRTHVLEPRDTNYVTIGAVSFSIRTATQSLTFRTTPTLHSPHLLSFESERFNWHWMYDNVLRVLDDLVDPWLIDKRGGGEMPLPNLPELSPWGMIASIEHGGHLSLLRSLVRTWGGKEAVRTFHDSKWTNNMILGQQDVVHFSRCKGGARHHFTITTKKYIYLTIGTLGGGTRLDNRNSSIRPNFSTFDQLIQRSLWSLTNSTNCSYSPTTCDLFWCSQKPHTHSNDSATELILLELKRFNRCPSKQDTDELKALDEEFCINRRAWRKIDMLIVMGFKGNGTIMKIYKSLLLYYRSTFNSSTEIH
ncbi:uncharacterized protein BDR25DRAFT_360693 [Lindgomyces ingoldianus]|uniref:Uncharacterized protein n=1 Tax=Lindgomyces ingoldianus TaxID=673940 RepID=A0ACB6QEB6_9PLEO|nr:uncharacterized protein BDR25DRAFT_360693 [Lindgomyces ingoldianus]KAF2465334.1 hypothetical protein BDR25DRAFT_360693 [Lindgomyces ingoldianus]